MIVFLNVLIVDYIFSGKFSIESPETLEYRIFSLN